MAPFRKFLLWMGMGRGRVQRSAVAWLALWALCLLLVAPSVSRLHMAAGMPSGMGAMCGDHGHAPPSTDPHHADALDACGYCVLIGHSPLLGGSIVFTVAALPGAPIKAFDDHQDASLAVARKQPARGPPAPALSTLASR
ncbi:DUF2946 family protein [Dyella sp. ASV21]|uniref:DUF2946 family protein n=1 Tax=Dyella sp. ASV21 TaxID=2795114 RepID=UPI0018EBF5F9|nr:DUF2946 family protein [Dyella sp. ASV21]